MLMVLIHSPYRQGRDSVMFRQVIINNAILLIQYAASAVVPLVLVPHIVRSIGVEAYGGIAVAVAWASFGAIAVQYAFHLTGPKRVAQLDAGESHARVFVEILVAKLVLLACALPLMAVVSWSAFPQSATGVHVAVMLALPAGAALNSSWYLQARGQFLWISVAAIAGATAALWVGFQYVGGADVRSVWAAAWATVAGPVFAGAATFVAAAVLVGRNALHAGVIRPTHSLREGWPLFISQFVATLYVASGPIVISHLAGTSDAGAYSAVERIINAVVGACLLTHTAAYPRLAAAYAHDRSEYWRLLKFVVTGYTAVTALVALIVWSFRKALIEFLFGSDFEYDESLIAWGLGWLVLGVFGTAVTGYMTVSARTKEVLPITLKVLVLSFALGVPGVLVFGGAGWMASLVLSQVAVLCADRKSVV